MFSLILSDLVSEKGQVFSFEPIPLMHKKLNNNINLNGIRNVTTIESGIGDTESEIEIFLNPEQSGLSTAVAKPGDNYISQKIKLLQYGQSDIFRTNVIFVFPFFNKCLNVRGFLHL